MKLHCSFLFLFSLFLLTFSHPSPAPRKSDSPPRNTTATDFIRTSCAKTLYPQICFSSLSGYTNAVKKNPAQLARVAIAVSLAKVRRITQYVSNFTREGSDSRATAALHDCVSNFGDAVEQIRESLKQMRRMGTSSAGSTSFKFMMSNVQTWMSAALTDEETCTDGLEEVAEGEVKEMMGEKVAEVKMYTSNALSLVNCYAESGTP